MTPTTGKAAPMSAWTALRDEIQDLRTAAYDVATDLTEEGKDAERAFGRVDGYDDVLLRMASIRDEPKRPSRAWHADWAVVDRDQDGNAILRHKPTGGRYKILPVEEC